MGLSLVKLTSGNDGKRSSMNAIAQKYDEQLLNKTPVEFSDFYRTVCEAVEEINSNAGNTQFRIPKEDALQRAFDKHHNKNAKRLTEDEFQRILHDAIMETGFTGIGAKDILLYIFGVPATALLVKQGIMPKALPNGIFIPAVTSATVFVLSQYNKI